jgi:hypothetical protein
LKHGSKCSNSPVLKDKKLVLYLKKIKVFVVSKIWYFNKSIYFYFSKIWVVTGYYAMVVCPIIHGYEFSKCLMDGGSSLNIMYVETLTKLGLTKTQLRHSAVTFYGVVPGRQAKSLGSITLRVAFGSEENYREEPITFEVVPFKSTYHVIFGRPAFHSFHARPCYIYN